MCQKERIGHTHMAGVIQLCQLCFYDICSMICKSMVWKNTSTLAMTVVLDILLV